MSVKPVPATKEAIKEAADKIIKGGVVAFPTETVYGLGANAFDSLAVAKLFELKKRPYFDPIIVHIADFEWLFKIASLTDIEEEIVKKLISKFWPGPLTLILPKKEIIPDIVTAGLPSVGIRMPAHPVARELIKEAKLPIAAPSANLFGYLSPTTAQQVYEEIPSGIDMILDGGRCPIGVESTVIDLTGCKRRSVPAAKQLQAICQWVLPTKQPQAICQSVLAAKQLQAICQSVLPTSKSVLPTSRSVLPTSKLVLPTILRLGGLPVEEIEKVIGKVRIKRKIPKRPHSPGQLAKHYSPKTPLKIIKDKEFKIPKKKRIGYLAFSKPPDSRISYDMIEILSKKGDLREAAANLFSALYRLDKAGLDIILAECIPEVGLGRAIMDRLYKASS